MRQSSINVGNVFGRLTVMERVSRAGRGMFVCKCECSKIKEIYGYNLRSGATRSCGCLNKEVAVARHIKHGHHSRNFTTPEYRAWAAMIGRCTNPNNNAAKDYSLRGITVSEQWLDFATFLKDMGPRPSPKHTLGRIDNDKGYCKENCRWETRTQQARNRRSNKYVLFRGEKICLAELAIRHNLSPQTLWKRLKRGWSLEEAISTKEKYPNELAPV